MQRILDELPAYLEKIQAIKEILLTNIVLIGQAPVPPFHANMDRKVQIFSERIVGLNVDECTIDHYGNPIAVIKGEALGKPPIVLVAHMDTVFQGTVIDRHYTIKENRIIGPGLIDNSVGIGVLLSLPEILKRLSLTFKSDIVIVGLVESLGKSNLASIRNLLSTWQSPIRGAVCVEGGELGRLNYYSRSMRRAQILCHVPEWREAQNVYERNSILILNELINEIMKIRIPQRPRTEIVFGQISGGKKHGESALIAEMGFEVQSDSEKIVSQVFGKIRDIVTGKAHERRVGLTMSEISNVKAARLDFSHPLVKNSVEIIESLGVVPIIESSESELSVFLTKNIPAITVGMAKGKDYHRENASVDIESIYTGIAQLIGIIRAIDEGVCDE